MTRIAITGGIGSGKTTATSYLASLGYPVIDADEALTAVTQPGSTTLGQLVDAFGSAIVNSDGSYNRKFVAQLVFNSPSALQRLNSITHKAIGEFMLTELARANGELVFVAIPLFKQAHRAFYKLDEVWGIVSDIETTLNRLTTHRQMSPEDAKARIATQMSNEERASLCDLVIENDGSILDLQAQIDLALKSKLNHG